MKLHMRLTFPCELSAESVLEALCL